MVQAFDAPGVLMTKTLTLLKEDKRNLLQIHKDTGLPLYWLRDFVQGRFRNPSVNRVEYLHNQLNSKSLSA